MLLAALHSDAARRPAVLLVDDHEDTCQMYVEFLQASFETMTAPDAEHALALAREHRPDVIVTDLALPGMDGLQLIAEVRRDPALASVPVVCLTGFGGDVHEDRARAAGSNRVLQKPCTPDTLAEVITGLLGEARQRSVES